MSENLTQNSFSPYQFGLVEAAIENNTPIETMTLTVKNGVYDFEGATVNNLLVSNEYITICNATIIGRITVQSAKNCCTFKNLTFRSNKRQLVFYWGTKNALFDKCVFENTDTDADSKVCAIRTEVTKNSGHTMNNNDNFILNDCHFIGYDAIVDANTNVRCVINNCKCTNVSKIVHCKEGTDLYANVAINNLRTNGIEYICQINNLIKANANIFVNGVIGTISGAVVDFKDGVVNLECNISGTSDYKLFSNDSPKTRYCNIQKYGDNAYRVVPEAKTYEFTMTLQPKETRYPFDSMHINSISGTANSNVEVFFRKNTVGNDIIQTVDEEIDISTDGVSINDTGTLVFKNTATTIQTFSFTVTTNCKLF